jgi:hypothetical protein
MPKTPGPQPGPKPTRPPSGQNGPNGSGGGTRTFKPKMPMGGKGKMTGTRGS